MKEIKAGTEIHVEKAEWGTFGVCVSDFGDGFYILKRDIHYRTKEGLNRQLMAEFNLPHYRHGIHAFRGYIYSWKK